jgi:hypothetical protein
MPYPGKEVTPGHTVFGSERVPNCTVRVHSLNGTTNGIVLTNKAGTLKVIYISDAGALACGTWDEFIAGATPA